MQNPIIEIDDLSKCYRLGRLRTEHAMFRDLLAGMVRSPWRRLRERRNVAANDSVFWALRGVSLAIRQGEVVGIIGRNGAGKSTLLKILSRITEPTRGQVVLRGRVASLLEVGTGFHPELTGRENVYLNGAILGMTRVEIDRKFDEIVAFAEVERFLDTPVKHYSSGMYVRLAFSVAAHLDPEILIVDEVLAVGDAAFQAKCFGKLRQVSQATGRTVLLVSHNMSAVTRLCSRGILLQSGTVVADTSADAAAAIYANAGRRHENTLEANGVELQIEVANAKCDGIMSWRAGTDLSISVRATKAPNHRLALDIALYSELGARVFSLQSDRVGHLLAADGQTLRITLSNIGLACSEITADVGVREPGSTDYLALWQSIVVLSVTPARPDPITVAPYVVDLPFTISAQ
jgi:ABC-type polysaccharide/polyol phosphate transport system ATPase subunit